MTSPTFIDILDAKQTIARYLPRTPLCHYAALDKICGAHILVKHENHLPTNAFKARNGLALISALTDEERTRGVVAEAVCSAGSAGRRLASRSRFRQRTRTSSNGPM